MTLGSDLDLVLIHEDGFKIDEIAEKSGIQFGI